MTIKQLTTVQMTDSDLASFRTYLEHKSNIDVMLAAGVFEVRRGSVEVHFDGNGIIGAITGRPTLYQRDTLIVVGTK